MALRDCTWCGDRGLPTHQVPRTTYFRHKAQRLHRIRHRRRRNMLTEADIHLEQTIDNGEADLWSDEFERSSDTEDDVEQDDIENDLELAGALDDGFVLDDESVVPGPCHYYIFAFKD